MPAIRRLRQEDYEFESSLGYVVSYFIKNIKQKQKRPKFYNNSNVSSNHRERKSQF
jgi:hypothetical protein